MTDYNIKTKAELIALCKERGIKGHSGNERTKENIIELLKKYNLIGTSAVDVYDNMKYDDLLALCRKRKVKGYFGRSSNGKVVATKEMMIKSLKDDVVRINLFDYLTEHNPSIIAKFVGNPDDLKTISYGTLVYYKWKCENYSECLNIFEAKPRDLYQNDFPRKYCNTCAHKNRKINNIITVLKRSGSIQTKFPFIIDIWSNENKKTPNEFSPGSNERVKLKCPNKSTKHPDYPIDISKIQENNSFRCPKCVTKTSNAEMKIYSELKYSFKDVRWQQKIEGREADVIIEDLKLVIEIDGFPWHKDKTEKDLLKNAIFEKNGYNVLRIRDLRLEAISCDNIICNLDNLSLTDYNKIVELINIKFKLNINKYDEWKNLEYYKEIQVSKMSVRYEESIEYLFPESKELWDYEKNYPFIPSQFSKGSSVEMWVKCNSGHYWKRRLCHLFRTINDKIHIMKCPECYSIKPIKPTKTMIQIDGISYNSISECCRELNINRRHVYKKLKKTNLDINNITNVINVINQLKNQLHSS